MKTIAITYDPTTHVLMPKSLLADAIESVEDYLGGLDCNRSDRKLLGRLKAALAAAPQPEGREQPEPVAVLRQISDHLSSMMASRTEIVDGICDVTGYQIKTGALHQIIGLLQAFKPVIISRTNRVMTQLPDAAHQPPPAQAEGQEAVAFLDPKTGSAIGAARKKQAEGSFVTGLVEIAKVHTIPLYTHPPRREWVKSTLEEKVILLLQHGCGERIPLLEEFEELLKGKNHV